MRGGGRVEGGWVWMRGTWGVLQADDGIRGVCLSSGLGEVDKGQRGLEAGRLAD